VKKADILPWHLPPHRFKDCYRYSVTELQFENPNKNKNGGFLSDRREGFRK
jgi:hypothetical protein